MLPDLLRRKQTHFVLWRPRETDPPPAVVLGTFQNGNPPSFAEHRRAPLRRAAGFPDLWEVAAAECGLLDGQVYHYWFEVADSDPRRQGRRRILCTDPTACTVDWRLLAPRLPPYGEDDRDPAAVVGFFGGALIPVDPGGERADWADDPAMASLPANNKLVIYELPTTWSRLQEFEPGFSLGTGTFRDVRALIELDAESVAFADMPALERGRAHLIELGVNALELLPPADSFVDREWGYATSNYFAPDHDLGFPRGHASPTASSDLASLVKSCHRNGVRFFIDVVMAFATRWSYETVNFLDFHVHRGTGDPEEDDRQDFGGALFKYGFRTEGYDPISGERRSMVPARRIMLAHLSRWLLDFRADGVRMDSVVNFGSWDFIQEFKDHGRAVWRDRAGEQGLSGPAAEQRFLVVAEELAVPVDLVRQHRVDSLWNEEFKRMVRAAILGRNDDKEPSFEWTVRKLVDCRLLGFRGRRPSRELRDLARCRGLPQRAPLQLPREQRRRRQGASDQARLRVPVHRGRHSDDPCGRGVRRSARPAAQASAEAGRPGEFRPPRGAVAPRYFRLRGAIGRDCAPPPRRSRSTTPISSTSISNRASACWLGGVAGPEARP